MYWAILLLSGKVFATIGWVLEIKSSNEFVVKSVSYEGNCENKCADLNKSIISNLLLFSGDRFYVDFIVAGMISEKDSNLDRTLCRDKKMIAMKLGALLLNQHTLQGDLESIKLLHAVLSILRPEAYSIIGYTNFNELNKETTDINLRRIGDSETEIKSGEELRETILRLYPHLKEEIEAMLPKVSHNWFSDKIASMASTYFTSMFSSNRNCNHTYKKL
ncbi:MAG: hypothetical protein WC755_08185 [Candidatus Woesearchaeota archaeon]|jgi:hypothetical protein